MQIVQAHIPRIPAFFNPEDIPSTWQIITDFWKEYWGWILTIVFIAIVVIPFIMTLHKRKTEENTETQS